MRTTGLVVGLAAVVLTSACSVPVLAQSKIIPAPATPTSSSEQRITIIGAVKRVVKGSHQLLFAGDDGRQYTLDMSRARITMEGGGLPVLAPGTRLYVSGHLTTGDNIAATRIQALPVAVPLPPPPAPASAEPLDYTVRGTVEAVDFERGAFVLRIKTHTRIVFVTADTDVSGLGPLAPSQFPVQPGRRVTVGGSLQPDGTVLAGLLTSKGDVDFRAAPSQPNRVLIGTVSSAANKLVRRNIKVRAADGTETKVLVPRNIPIRRSGHQISVYDLSSRDEIRVTGRTSGSDLQAYRIDVLAPVAAAVPANPPTDPIPTPSARPGL